MASRRPHPAARAAAARGLLHGLSLVLLTVALLGAAAFFALYRFPLRCACEDHSLQDVARTGLESPQKRCQMACAGHGGGAPVGGQRKAR